MTVSFRPSRGAIVRASGETPGAAELVVRRWSWPGPGGKPVYNYRLRFAQYA
ncbi:hypothetical protein [Allosphingosinicella sp.]|uniref:hypothetical protein n=1 Tax=Allosphingosinicella sp. TaxID=2823234 RepID=UPI002FC1EA3F